jgi:hypothetical protein
VDEVEAVHIDLVMLQVKILSLAQHCSLLCGLLSYFPQQPLWLLNDFQEISSVFNHLLWLFPHCICNFQHLSVITSCLASGFLEFIFLKQGTWLCEMNTACCPQYSDTKFCISK